MDSGFGCGCAATKLCPANQSASFSNTAYGVTLYISIKPSNQALVNDTITGAPEKFRVIDLGASGRVALQSMQTGALLKCPSNGMVCSADTNPYVDIGWSFELQQTGGNNLQLLSEFNSFIGLAPAFPVPALAIGFVTGDAKAQFTYVCQ